MKDVQNFSWSTHRYAFHPECWRKYHGIEMKKSAIAYGGLFLGCVGMLLAAYFSFLYGEVFPDSRTILPLMTIGLTIAVLVYLGITYYRIKK